MSLPDMYLIETRRFEDDRGFFSEIYNKAALADHGIDDDFVQDNFSLSRAVGTLRGLHFQTPPHAQAKLVRVLRGAVFDVAVDLRRGSPNFGKHTSAILSAENWLSIYIPVGFAHGFVTLAPDTDVVYKVGDRYSAECDSGIIWNDPDLAIGWPLPPGGPVVSDKDKNLKPLADFSIDFPYKKKSK